MDVWQILRDRLDYASFVPAPRADVQRADLRRRDGTPYTMLKNPHGDNGAGLGASHQTGWTGLVGQLIRLFGLVDAQTYLESGKPEGATPETGKQKVPTSV